jgi:hypothetical protein
MAITKVLAVASLVLFALAAAPVAQAQNTGDGTTVTRPHKGVDPAQKAERQVRRKQQREMQRQQQGPAPTMPSRGPSN